MNRMNPHRHSTRITSADLGAGSQERSTGTRAPHKGHVKPTETIALDTNASS